jgi:integrase
MPVRVWLAAPLYEALKAQDALAREVEVRESRIVPWLFFFPESRGGSAAGDRVLDFDNSWKAARVAAQLPGLRFHDLRRGAILTLRRAGLTEHEIMEWCGIKTRAVFDRYDIVDEDRLKDMGQKVQAYHAREAASVGVPR